MSTAAKFVRFKELVFLRADDQEVSLPVPDEIDQTLLRKMVFSEYLIVPMSAGRPLAESEVATLRFRGDKVGFLIPGQALLSPEHPMNTDRLFGAYSIFLSWFICQQSQKKKYDLIADTQLTATSRKDIFLTDVFYAVIWTKKLLFPKVEFFHRYFVSFAKVGIYPFYKEKNPSVSSRTLDSYKSNISLSVNRSWPPHVEEMVTGLFPFAEDPFLRFFYLYQVVETLMSEEFSDQLIDIRQRFYLDSNMSNTKLRDYIGEFQAVVKEAPRIRAALVQVCSITNNWAESILTTLGEDLTSLNFADRIYKIRNIIFHDFRRIRHLNTEVAELGDSLLTHILNKNLV